MLHSFSLLEQNTEEALKERLMKLQAQLESSNKQCQDSSTRVQILEGSNRQLKNELKLVERELKVSHHFYKNNTVNLYVAFMAIRYICQELLVHKVVE